MEKPAIEVFQIKQDAFYFMGIEYHINKDPDFADIWDSFFKAGGFEKIEPYQKEPFFINVWHNYDPESPVYFIGKIAHDTAVAPDGYTIRKFPARDYLVVTHDWLEDHERIVGEDGNGRCNRYADTVKMPEGYERHDGNGSGITLIEREYFESGKGHRYEVWVPIKKKS